MADCIEKIFENSVNIALASDNNYAYPTLVSIHSLITNTSKDNNYDIIVLESNITEENKNLIQSLCKNRENISVRFFNTTKYFEEFEFFHCMRYTSDTYGPLFLPDVLKDYDKVIYIDSDTIVLTDIARLYNLDLQDNYLAGCRSPMHLLYRREQDIRNYYDNILKIKNIKNNINSGVLLMNLTELRKINLAQAGMDMLNRHKRLLFHDEDILNKVCQDKIIHISSSWNWGMVSPELLHDYQLLPLAQEWSKGLFEQNIIHYWTKEKPWNCPKMYYSEIWWKYAKETPIYQQLLKNYFDKHPEDLE